MRSVLVEKTRLPVRSLIVRVMKFYRCSKLIIIRVSPRAPRPRPVRLFHKTNIPRVCQRTRALIPVIPAINRASRTRSVINNERLSRRKVAASLNVVAQRRRAMGMLGWRELQAAAPTKTYGSAGRVISCLLDRLYTLSPTYRASFSFPPAEFSGRGTTIILQSRRECAPLVTSSRCLSFFRPR